MKSLPALFTLTVSILLAGMVQGGRSVSILAGPGSTAALPTFSGNVLALSPLLLKTMTSVPTDGIQQPSNPSTDPQRSQGATGTDALRQEHRNLSPVWWAIGALVLIVVIAMIAMSTRSTNRTTAVRP